MTQSAEQVARGLTEAQREVLLCAHKTHSDREGWSVYFLSHAPTLKALQRRALIRGWGLTPLGLEVRRILESDRHD